MGTKAMEELRYPIGRFRPRESTTMQAVAEEIGRIEAAPARLRAAVAGLSEEQLDTPYRPAGWTVRQVVHHLPDSHANGYVRFKLALTEESPLIRTYAEERWAELPEARTAPVEPSLELLERLHARWVLALRALGPDELARELRHPDMQAPLSVSALLSLYAWHGEHHVAHVTGLREREGW